MNPNNELDRERLIKAIENSTILPHHRAAGQGKHVEATFDQLTKSQHEVLG
ncbi:MAG: hypothetical protein HOH50_08775 [Planctomycetaceae bacterium]|jgi:hypothetical protein|nr:hypothetical protein [Planctomycetaceae bacterium]